MANLNAVLIDVKGFIEKHSGIVGLIELYSVGILWGLGTIVAKLFLRAGFSELQVAFLRASLGAVSLLALIAILKKMASLKPHRDIWLLIFNGVSYALMYFAHLMAINISVAHGTIHLIAAPIFVAILSPIFLQEELQKKTIYAVIFTIIGISFLIASSMGGEAAIPAHKMLFSDLMGITAGFFAAFYIMSGRKLKRSYDALAISFWSMLVASILFGAPLIVFGFPSFASFDSSLIFGALFMGVGINGVGVYLNMDGVRRVVAQRAVIIQMILDPLVSIFLAWLFWGETPTLLVITGAMFMVSALYIATKEEAAIHLAVEKLPVDAESKRILLAIKQLGSASISRLEEETGLPADLISEKIKELVEKGYLIKREEGILKYWERVIEEEKKTLDNLKSKIVPEKIDEAVLTISNSRVIYLCEKNLGLNFSNILKSYFQSAGVVATIVPPDPEHAKLVLRSMMRKDVLFVVDYVFHEKIIDLEIEIAKRRGAKIVAVADNFTQNYIKNKVDILLNVELKRLGLPISLVPLMAMLDSIVLGVAIQKRRIVERVSPKGGGAGGGGGGGGL